MSPFDIVDDRKYLDLFDLRGRTALVTGAARGLGFGISKRIAELGADIVIADMNEALAAESASEIEERYGVRAEAHACDANNEDDVVALVRKVADAHPTIDILVNNAGVFPYAPLLKMDTAELDLVLGVDLRAPFLFVREVGRVMTANNTDGRIVNISSMNAFRSPHEGTSHYDAAKAGLLAFTRSLAIELGPSGIRVNAIAPGLNMTEGQKEAFGVPLSESLSSYPAFFQRWIGQMPARRVGGADDQARAVAFLVSDAAAYITGACLVVDGGMSLV